MLSVSLGPLALSISHVVLLVALGLAMLVARRCSNSGPGRAADSALFWLFALSVVAARLAFVALYWAQYRPAPWQVLDLRDGGFVPWAGIVLAGLVALAFGWRKPAQRRALGWGVTAGLTVWLAGGMALGWQEARSSLPHQPLVDSDGAPVTLSRYQGQPMVVNLWATWCPPCRREMPVLVAAQKARPGVRFVYVNQGETPAMAATFLGTAGVNPADVLYDSTGSLARAVGAMAYPTTLFYGPDGQLKGSHLGELSGASLEAALKVFD